MSRLENGDPPTIAMAFYASARDLADAMRRASAAHDAHEKQTGAADPKWSDRCAAHMLAEQAGREPRS